MLTNKLRPLALWTLLASSLFTVLPAQAGGSPAGPCPAAPGIEDPCDPEQPDVVVPGIGTW